MRRIITFSLILLGVFVVYGAAQPDSIKVYFALDKATYNPTLDDNAASMERFIDGLAASLNSVNLDHIVVYGYASPDGPFRKNDKLSRQRCKAIAEYISRNAGIPMKDIQTKRGGVAWDGLRALVIDNPQTPHRDEVLRILDEYLPDACTDRAKSDRCRKRLDAIDGGRTFRWMVDNLFTRLRYSLAVYTYEYEAPDSVTVCKIIDNEHQTLGRVEVDPGQMFAADASVANPYYPAYIYDPTACEPLHRLAIKTNMLYDAALLPNLEVEWRINDYWSVALEGDLAWWGNSAKEKSYRLAIVSPEVKRWINPRAPWHGLYIGAFAGAGLYDLENGKRGYYGEGAMGGLSVGYMWPLSRTLSLEAEIGGGYLYTRCKEYIPFEGHHVYQRTRDINYFGPLKVKLSLVWRLWDLNKPRCLNAQKFNGGAI